MIQNYPKVGQKWKHHNGIEYEVILLGNEDAAPERRDEYPVCVSYKGANGKVWTKTLENFQSKMTLVA